MAVLGVGVGIWLFVRASNHQGGGEVIRVHADSEEELGPIVGLIPDGEWWGKSDKFLVVLQMVGNEGIAAIAGEGASVVVSVTLTMPEIEELVYVLSGPDGVSTWVGRVPDVEIPPEAIGTDEDAITEIIIDRVDGFLAGTPEFRLLHSVRHDPAQRLSDGEMSVVEELRGVVEARQEEIALGR